MHIQQVCSVYQLRYYVLFLYSVQSSHNFLWLLGLYGLHLTGIPYGPSSAPLTSPVIVHQ